MRNFVFDQIRAAAVAAGLAETAVVRAPKQAAPDLPERRLEIDLQSERYLERPRPIASFPTAGHEATHRTIRRAVYTVELPVVAIMRGDNEEWLDSITGLFERKLSRRVAGPDNNLVRFSIARAQWGGFNHQMVTVFKRVSRVYHITASWMICNDRDVALITDVQINPEYSEG